MQQSLYLNACVVCICSQFPFIQFHGCAGDLLLMTQLTTGTNTTQSPSPIDYTLGGALFYYINVAYRWGGGGGGALEPPPPQIALMYKIAITLSLHPTPEQIVYNTVGSGAWG